MGLLVGCGVRPEFSEQGIIVPSLSVHQVVGNTVTVVRRPDYARFLHLAVEVNDFRFRPGKYDSRTFTDTDVTVLTNVIADAGHGFVDGDGPYRLSTGGTLPDGLSATEDYYVGTVDANSYKFYTTRQKAISKKTGQEVNLLDAGSAMDVVTVNALAATPSASQVTGQGSVLLDRTNCALLMIGGPSAFTVLGSAAGSKLSYWWSV